MCGFVGVINFDEGLNSNFPIKQATNCLIDRGPDSEGFFSNEFCSMGFRRLSIIDLSKNADTNKTYTTKTTNTRDKTEKKNNFKIFKTEKA